MTVLRSKSFHMPVSAQLSLAIPTSALSADRGHVCVRLSTPRAASDNTLQRQNAGIWQCLNLAMSMCGGIDNVPVGHEAHRSVTFRLYCNAVQQTLCETPVRDTDAYLCRSR